MYRNCVFEPLYDILIITDCVTTKRNNGERNERFSQVAERKD